MKIRPLLTYLFLTCLILFGSAASIWSQKEQGVEVKSGNLEGTVEVSFKIDHQGKIEVLSMNATSPQLADYVLKKLKKVQLEKGDPQIGQVIKYRFVFKKQA